MSGNGVLLALELPVPLDELGKHTSRLTAEHPCDTLLMTQHHQHLLIITTDFAKVMDCWCAACEGEVTEALEKVDIWTGSTFIVCRDCGNKRCPRAASHEYRCTRSNDTGQQATRV